MVASIASTAQLCCCLPSPPPHTSQSLPGPVVPTQTGRVAFTGATSGGLSEEHCVSTRWAPSTPGHVALRTNARERDRRRTNGMVAEEYERHGRPPTLQQQQHKERGQFPRPPVVTWKKHLANSMQLMGLVTRDFKIKYLGSGRVVATTSLTVGLKESDGTEDDPSCITLEIWDELAEIAAHDVNKGDLILVAGKIVIDKWVKYDVSYTEVKVVARDISFVELCGDQRQSDSHSNEEFAVRGFSGARWNGCNVAQLEPHSHRTAAGTFKWKGSAKNLNPSLEDVGGNDSRHQKIASLKVELKQVGGIEANRTRSETATYALNTREPDFLCREVDGQSSPISEVDATENSVRRDSRREDLPRKALRMNDRSTAPWVKAGRKLIAPDRSQSRSGPAKKDWSLDTLDADTMSEAIAVLQQRLQQGLTIDSNTYVRVLQMCLKQKDLVAAKQVYDCSIQSGMDKNVYVAGTLLNLYIKCGALVDARRVFDQLEQKNVVTWTNMIAGYVKSDRAESALELFSKMRQEGVEPNEITYLTILKACTTPLALQWGKQIHECIRLAGYESDARVGTALIKMYADCGSITEASQVFEKVINRDVMTWTAIIGGLAQHGDGQEAYRLFCRMRQEGLEPDSVTYLSILNVSASGGSLGWVKKVHGHARKAGLESDLRVGSALIHMYAESGSIDDARRVFDRMEKRDVVTWTAMIGGLAYHGYGIEALELFRKMNADGVKPDETAFVAVLSACCHGGLVDDGRRLFSAMTQDYGIEPTVVHYTCMVDLLGRTGHLEEAKLFISQMPVEPDVITWSALLGACRTYGNVEMGELAANEIFKLKPSMSYTYVLLSNIYAAAGKWANVSLVRTMMQERGVKKEPGRSWIEVDNKVHSFVVGDTSHPEAKGIQSYLKALTERLKAEGYIPETRLVLHNINEEDKELALCSHSEKFAIAYGLMHLPRGEPIRVNKNLRVCTDCHTATKFISKVTGRDIIARDANRFHHFKGGVCSCGDHW